MKALCIFIGVFTILFGAWIWLNTPTYSIPEYEQAVPKILYNIATVASLIGGVFWFVLAKILDNQEDIKKKLGISKEESHTKSPFGGKVF